MMEGTNEPPVRRRHVQQPESAPVENPFRTSVERALKQADIFPKVETEHETQTSSGGLISIVCFSIITYLFLGELRSFIYPKVSEHISVDTSRSSELPIEFDLTFHALRCSEVHVDVMDVSGEQQMDIFEGEGGSTLKRTRLDSHGKVIGKPIDHRQSKRMADQGAAPQDRSGEGCHVFGHLLVNKVQGNMHVAIGAAAAKNGKHFHQFPMSLIERFNASHRINRLHFGEREFPGATNPLNGLEEIIPEGWPGAVHFQYYVKVVPMVYQDTFGRDVHSTVLSMTRNNFTIGTLDMVSQKIPGVFFFYEPSPYLVRVKRERMPLSRFIMSTCAIVGGVLTIAGLVDRFLFEIGKLYGLS